MDLRKRLSPLLAWTPEQVQEALRTRYPERLTLLDVRQAAEYGRSHLPGAVHIPLGELRERLSELNPGLATIVYCSGGMRSRAAAAMLAHAGFGEVHPLKGGIEAWQGPLAEGQPEDDLLSVRQYSTPEELTVYAWYLEDGARSFYAEMARTLCDPEATALFRDLESAEEHHQATLLAVYEGLTGASAPADFPLSVLPAPPEEGFMEGGWTLLEALDWTRGRPLGAILELAMAMETSALDRYLYLGRNLPEEKARQVFEVLANEEERHLKRLAAVLDHFI